MNSLQKVQVEKMRASGIGFKEISERINIPISTIKSYCYKHSIRDMTAENDVRLCPQCGQPVPKMRFKPRRFCSDAFAFGIRDEKAKAIIDALGVDVSKYDPFLSHEGVVARTIMFRDTLKDLLARYPDAVCINLGCGFDDKFSQVDNGRLQWFDVDLPDQIAVRRKVFQDRDRCTMLDGDALDGAWTKALPKADMYIIVVEGVLEYFSKAQVKTCLNMLCDCFPHGYLLAELHYPFLEKHGSHHDAVKHTNATFGWGTKSGEDYLELEPRMELLSEHSYNEEMRKYTIRGKLFAIIGKRINNRLAVYQW